MITAKEARKITEDSARTEEYNKVCVDKIMHEIIHCAKTGECAIEVELKLIPDIGTNLKIRSLGYHVQFCKDYVLISW